MDEHTDNLTLARQAYAAQDWATAAAHFDGVATKRLTANDLAAYADAVWWLGRIEDNLRLNAAACEAFLVDSRPVEAAWAAMVLGIFHMARGDEPQGMGWIGRAGRLLEGIPECPVHGYLLSFTAGVGENNPALRAAVVDGLDGLGFSVDPELNAVRSNQARVISPAGAPITIAVVPTNEELAIARQTASLLEARSY